MVLEYPIKIFILFSESMNVHKRNRRKGASGFGLGLKFVDQVVEAHHGKIFVSSIEGEFTEFTIYLPLAEDKNPMQNG